MNIKQLNKAILSSLKEDYDNPYLLDSDMLKNVTIEFCITVDDDITDHSYDTFSDAKSAAEDFKKEYPNSEIMILLQATGWDEDNCPDTIEPIIDICRVI